MSYPCDFEMTFGTFVCSEGNLRCTIQHTKYKTLNTKQYTKHETHKIQSQKHDIISQHINTIHKT